MENNCLSHRFPDAFLQLSARSPGSTSANDSHRMEVAGLLGGMIQLNEFLSDIRPRPVYVTSLSTAS